MIVENLGCDLQRMSSPLLIFISGKTEQTLQEHRWHIIRRFVFHLLMNQQDKARQVVPAVVPLVTVTAHEDEAVAVLTARDQRGKKV